LKGLKQTSKSLSGKPLRKHKDLKRKVNELLASANLSYTGKTDIKHSVTILHQDIGLKAIKNMVARPLKEIRVAPFYGCHLIRPHEYVSFDDPEFPVKLDELIEATGAKSVYHLERTGCCIGCGSFFGEVAEEAALRLVVNILNSVKSAEADCIVVTCPYCFLQLEMGQLQYRRRTGEEFNTPVLYYTDLLGLSLNLEPKDLGMNLHRIRSTHLLEKISR